MKTIYFITIKGTEYKIEKDLVIPYPKTKEEIKQIIIHLMERLNKPLKSGKEKIKITTETQQAVFGELKKGKEWCEFKLELEVFQSEENNEAN